MKIIHVLTSLLRAGAEENTLATCRGQVARGHDVWLIHGENVEASTRDMVPKGVKVIQVAELVRDVKPIQDLSALRKLTSEFRKLSPDVVHTHQSKAGIVGRLAAKNAQVPIILHGVHILPFLNVSWVKRLIYLSMEKYVASATDAYIAVARGMHDANLAAGLGTESNNHIVYSGMNIERFQTAKPTPDAPKGRVIAFVASLEPRKRHMAFFDIFARIVQRWPDAHLCLFGQGEMEDALRAKAAALGISEHVHFKGFRSDVERWIAASDICVLPSMREGLPRVVVQYVAAGRPVVVSQLPGIEEIVEDGGNGFLVDLDSLDGMDGAIERLFSEPQLHADMTNAARARDLSQWSETRMEADIDAIMMQVADRKGVRAQIVHDLKPAL